MLWRLPTPPRTSSCGQPFLSCPTRAGGTWTLTALPSVGVLTYTSPWKQASRCRAGWPYGQPARQRLACFHGEVYVSTPTLGNAVNVHVPPARVGQLKNG